MRVEFSKYALTAPKHHASVGTNLSVVDHWIGRCSRDHRRCAENGELWYPSRLLRLSRSRGVKLIISKDSPPKGSYITLSHRWAAQPYTKLKASTIVQLQHGIDVATLPQIFQDTITIARHLRIKHLWIDALCIIQEEDNNSDWEKESQNMDKIYSCAFLNVSATMSIDGTESLFRERSWGLLLPSEIELEVNELNQKYYILDGDIWYDDIIDAPLNKRGWVFQERFLARRVLHFGQRQMGWECRELEALEMFPEGLVPAWAISSLSKSKFASMMANLTQRSDETPDLESVSLWQDLVTEYSKCKLTYSKDKLIAFLGVAKRMMEARTDHYAAGMWEKGMVYDLAWWRLSEDREAFPISDTSWRAPSWSWASADGEINFPSTYGVKHRFIHILESSELIKNPSSAISPPASIRIKGHCLPLSLECSNEEIVGFKVARSRFPVGGGARGSTVDLELPEEELLLMAQRGRVLFLPLFATSYSLYAIVMTKIRGICAHRRLGAVEIPIMEEIDQEVNENSRLGKSQAYAWVREQSAGRLNVNSKYWSVAAIKLLRYLLNPGSVYRTIDIY